MRLSFYGAAGEVTGSCYLLETGRARVLIDFGLHQGGAAAEHRNRRFPPLDPARLDCMVLTHGHLDHCGRLPLLTRHGFSGPIVATPATCDLTEIILKDAAEIQEADAERANRYRPGRRPVQPLYTVAETAEVYRLFSPLRYDQRREIAPGVSLRFVDAGHIIGSASVELVVHEAGQERIVVFSGDIGEAGSPLLKDPTPLHKADVLVMESTYGDRDHRSRKESVAELLGVLDEAREASGKVLIPAFAVGRTQQLIYCFGELFRQDRLRTTRVYVDSPMAVSATELYRRHREVFDDESWALIDRGLAPLDFPGLSYTRSRDESKRLNEAEGGAVIISASGMCTGGRIVHHLRHGLSHEGTHIVFVGFQAEGTLGRRLVDGAASVRILGDDIPVRARMHTIGGFSAHAGQTGLVRWASHFKGERPRLFLTHGEPKARLILGQKLAEGLELRAGYPEFGQVEEV
jgi:metallo-beta-lactamase family protein